MERRGLLEGWLGAPSGAEGDDGRASRARTSSAAAPSRGEARQPGGAACADRWHPERRGGNPRDPAAPPTAI